MLSRDMCGFRSVTSLSHHIFCIRLRNCFPPLRLVRTYRGGKTINASFEEFKEKDTLFVRQWLRQKGLEK